jgi:hypothetical protein
LSAVRWKVVECSTVTDESLESILNEWVGRGYTFEGMQFAMRESSKRPAMAFVLFTARDEGAAPAAPDAGPRGDDGQL